LGLTATPYRRDGLDDLIGFQLGPVRHTLEHADPDTLEGANSERPHPVLVAHPTQFRLKEPVDFSVPGAIAGVHRALAEDDSRNEQIVTDVLEALDRGRHCLVLAHRTSHVDHLAQRLAGQGRAPVLLKGGMGARARAAATERLVPTADGPPMVVVATGHYVGEGFDCPALDTLFLAGPGVLQGTTRAVRRSGASRAPRQADGRGSRLPRRRDSGSSNWLGQARTWLPQPRFRRPPQAVTAATGAIALSSRRPSGAGGRRSG
jgi:hypothetical protein